MKRRLFTGVLAFLPRSSSSFELSHHHLASAQRFYRVQALRKGFPNRLNALESFGNVFPRCQGEGMRYYATTSNHEEVTMQDILYRVRDVNHMPSEIRKSLLDFRVDGQVLGKLRPMIANKLCSRTMEESGKSVAVFVKENDDETGKEYVTFAAHVGNTFDARSEAVAQVTEGLRDEGFVTGWRDELYPVGTSFYDPPVFVMERAAVPLLGAIEYGVHINGLVQQDDGTTKMWIARRSKDKSKFPGMLDHIVAGGQPEGISLMDNVVKECLEEAGIPEDLTRAGIRSAGAISYENYSHCGKETVSRAVLFNFDLYLPSDFVPKPVDGEVEEFFLWTIDEVIQSMAKNYHDPIKPNCYSVIIDFLLRHGYISPDTPGYLDVLRELRSGDCH